MSVRGHPSLPVADRGFASERRFGWITSGSSGSRVPSRSQHCDSRVSQRRALGAVVGVEATWARTGAINHVLAVDRDNGDIRRGRPERVRLRLSAARGRGSTATPATATPTPTRTPTATASVDQHQLVPFAQEDAESVAQSVLTKFVLASDYANADQTIEECTPRMIDRFTIATRL